MTKKCKEKLLLITRTGTKLNAHIGRELIKLGDKGLVKFNRVAVMASLFKISNSSVTRFIQKLGYPSFKHFEYEFNHDLNFLEETETFNVVDANSKNEVNQINYYNLAKDLKKFIKKPKEIFIIPSKNTKIISSFLKERLEIQGIKVNVFCGCSSDVGKFIKSAKGFPILLITISGYSNVFSKSIIEISKNRDNIQNKVVILSVNNVFQVFDKYDYMYVLTTNASKEKYLFDTWFDYNFRILEIISLLTHILNYAFI